MYGFDTAGSLAEETSDPRRKAPRSILGSLVSVALIGALLIIGALCAADDLSDPELGRISGGMPYVIKQALGPRLGLVLLCDVVLAVNGADVDGPGDVMAALRDLAAGDRVTLRLVRDGGEKTVDVTVEERPAGERAGFRGGPAAWGLAVSGPDLEEQLEAIGPEIERRLEAIGPELERRLEAIGPELEKRLETIGPEIERRFRRFSPPIDA